MRQAEGEEGAQRSAMIFYSRAFRRFKLAKKKKCDFFSAAAVKTADLRLS